MEKRSIAADLKAAKRAEKKLVMKEKEMAVRKAVTMDFIKKVENGGAYRGPGIAAYDLGIGGDSGNSTWAKYRSGKRSWPIPALKQKILRASKIGYIKKDIAEKLLSDLHIDYSIEKNIAVDGGYKFDVTELLFYDISRTIEQLLQQIDGLDGRLIYGDKRLEKAHYLTTSLMLLEPVQTFITGKINEKKEEEIQLKAEFGNENYKEIFPIEPPKSLSAIDVGFSDYWWTKPAPAK